MADENMDEDAVEQQAPPGRGTAAAADDGPDEEEAEGVDDKVTDLSSR